MSEYLDEYNGKFTSYRSATSSPVPWLTKSDTSSGYYSSSPPTPSTPQSLSPAHTLKRSRTSSFKLINRRIVSAISDGSRLPVPHPANQTPKQPDRDRLASVIGWYPSFLLRIYVELLSICVSVVFKRLPVIVPALWALAWLWLCSRSLILVLSVLKNVLVRLLGRDERRRRRAVLISGGCCVQAVHLARNLHSAGARVIVCEVEGEFAAARFSTSVDKYYPVPAVDDSRVHAYIEALKEIVVRERVEFFVPVSATTSAYYDAMAKPHLEVLGCRCVCPEVREVLLLNDLLELLRKVRGDGNPTPIHYPITSNLELKQLYDAGILKKGAHFMVSTGVEGCKNRVKVELPRSSRKLQLSRPISEQHPWLVVQRHEGRVYTTCTTIRDSRIVCNVTCETDELGGLLPVEQPCVEQYLEHFFAALKAHTSINGHFSFHFTVARDTGNILLTDCEVGVRLPYICYTKVQSRLLWRSCRHFNRRTSGPVIVDGGRYWMSDVLINAVGRPSIRRIGPIFKLLVGRNADTLFALSDPLPYCAYYYIQLPLNKMYSVTSKLRNQRMVV